MGVGQNRVLFYSLLLIFGAPLIYGLVALFAISFVLLLFTPVFWGFSVSVMYFIIVYEDRDNPRPSDVARAGFSILGLLYVILFLLIKPDGQPYDEYIIKNLFKQYLIVGIAYVVFHFLIYLPLFRKWLNDNGFVQSYGLIVEYPVWGLYRHLTEQKEFNKLLENDLINPDVYYLETHSAIVLPIDMGVINHRFKHLIKKNSKFMPNFFYLQLGDVNISFQKLIFARRDRHTLDPDHLKELKGPMEYLPCEPPVLFDPTREERHQITEKIQTQVANLEGRNQIGFSMGERYRVTDYKICEGCYKLLKTQVTSCDACGTSTRPY